MNDTNNIIDNDKNPNELVKELANSIENHNYILSNLLKDFENQKNYFDEFFRIQDEIAKRLKEVSSDIINYEDNIKKLILSINKDELQKLIKATIKINEFFEKISNDLNLQTNTNNNFVIEMKKFLKTQNDIIDNIENQVDFIEKNKTILKNMLDNTILDYSELFKQTITQKINEIDDNLRKKISIYENSLNEFIENNENIVENTLNKFIEKNEIILENTLNKFSIKKKLFWKKP